MKVQTGQGTIPLITLIGIFSISALNALPGLAVSPILGDLNKGGFYQFHFLFLA